jgi:hypothetical protein
VWMIVKPLIWTSCFNSFFTYHWSYFLFNKVYTSSHSLSFPILQLCRLKFFSFLIWILPRHLFFLRSNVSYAEAPLVT